MLFTKVVVYYVYRSQYTTTIFQKCWLNSHLVFQQWPIAIFILVCKCWVSVRGYSYIDFHGTRISIFTAKYVIWHFGFTPTPPPSEHHTKKWNLLCNHPILPCHGSLFSLLVQHAPFTFCTAMLCWKAMASHTYLDHYARLTHRSYT